jgi:hypothetical protein
MNRPAYAHVQQRSFYSLDRALFDQVERIEQPRPEPIPVGEARELHIPGLAELVRRMAS